jgi:hypothetical protein
VNSVKDNAGFRSRSNVTHLRKRGYWPTMYMMLEAMQALLLLPRWTSHRLRRSCKSEQPGKHGVCVWGGGGAIR